MSQPPRTRPATRRVPEGSRSQPPPQRRRASAPPPRRDPFPYILGGILTVVLIGIIFVVVFLLSSNQNNTVVQAPPATAIPGAVVENVPTTAPGGDPASVPRMTLAEFKALYDAPDRDQKMLIIDVRSKEAFDTGHIQGAESWPEADIDARAVKLPKDKLIVGYCQ